MKKCYVYWIRHPGHTDIFSQGYIGITYNFNKRMSRHKTDCHNPYLKKIITKYTWASLIKEKILISTREYCEDIEKLLRPNKKLGWNFNIGGEKLPDNSKENNPKFKSKVKGTKTTDANYTIILCGEDEMKEKGFHSGSISDCINKLNKNGSRKTHKGFYWERV